MSVIDTSAGAVFIGCILSVLFFGATLTQAIVFVQNSHPDVWIVKAVVFMTITLELLHNVLVTHGAYMYTVRNIASPENLSVIPWSLLSLTLVTCFNVGVVRVLFVRRIWYLSEKNRVVTGIPIMLSIGSFAVAFSAGVRVLSLSTSLQIKNTPWIVYATMGADVCADISIAGTLWYYLNRAASGYEKTSSLLQSLSLYIIGTGAVTVLWDFMEVVMFATLQNTLVFAIFFLSLSNLYTNALLALLNARPMMNRRLNRISARFEQPEFHVPSQRTQFTSHRTSRSLDEVVELRSSQNAKVVALEMGHALASDSASAVGSPEKTSRL